MDDVALIEEAKRVAVERGWTWLEPINAEPTRFTGVEALRIETNYASRGANITIVLRRADAAVLHAAYLAR